MAQCQGFRCYINSKSVAKYVQRYYCHWYKLCVCIKVYLVWLWQLVGNSFTIRLETCVCQILAHYFDAASAFETLCACVHLHWVSAYMIVFILKK